MLSIIMAMVLVFSMQVQASLQNLRLGSINYRLIYDTDPDITWYDYANASATWQSHMNWASGLSIDFENTAYDDWKLPSTLDSPLSESPSQEWKFSIYVGQQMNFTKNSSNYDIGIRNGDVAAAGVFEPISSTITGETVGFAFHKAF
jgi:hypothetical protein